MKTYEYPQNLIDYLTEQESEGNEIFITHTNDAVAFIIPQKGLDKWVVYIEWYNGQDGFELVNITASAFDRLTKVMAEQ
jgi:hypothetical protein